MASSTFHRGGVARLRSPPIWEQGPLCVHFAYHLFGLSWGAQLKLLLLRDTKKKRPSLLWKHTNTQSPSWIPTAVTVPMGLALPSQVRVRQRAEPWAPGRIWVGGGRRGRDKEGAPGPGHPNSGRKSGGLRQRSLQAAWSPPFSHR